MTTVKIRYAIGNGDVYGEHKITDVPRVHDIIDTLLNDGLFLPELWIPPHRITEMAIKEEA